MVWIMETESSSRTITLKILAAAPSSRSPLWPMLYTSINAPSSLRGWLMKRYTPLPRFQNLDHSNTHLRCPDHHISPCKCQRWCLKASIHQNRDFRDRCLSRVIPSLLSQEFLEIITPATRSRCQIPLSPKLCHPFSDSSRNTTTHSMNMGFLGCLVPQHMDHSHPWESSRSSEITALTQKCPTASHPTWDAGISPATMKDSHMKRTPGYTLKTFVWCPNDWKAK